MECVTQVDIGGLEHSLTSIAIASPLIHVIDTPTRFMDALWLPYRRDRSVLEAAVEAAGPVRAVFAHADVVGPTHLSSEFQWNPVDFAWFVPSRLVWG